MTRIVVDPEELKRIAGYAAEAAAAYAAIGTEIAELALPEIPAGVREPVAAGLARAADRLARLSSQLDGQAFLLRARASLLENETVARMLLDVGGDADE